MGLICNVATGKSKLVSRQLCVHQDPLTLALPSSRLVQIFCFFSILSNLDPNGVRGFSLLFYYVGDELAASALFAIFVFLVDEIIKLAKAKSNAEGLPPVMLWAMISLNTLSFVAFGILPLVDPTRQILHTSVKAFMPSIVRSVSDHNFLYCPSFVLMSNNRT